LKGDANVSSLLGVRQFRHRILYGKISIVHNGIFLLIYRRRNYKFTSLHTFSAYFSTLFDFIIANIVQKVNPLQGIFEK
jgi:hypothetical protein